jgi:hypothetical protein
MKKRSKTETFSSRNTSNSTISKDLDLFCREMMEQKMLRKIITAIFPIRSKKKICKNKKRMNLMIGLKKSTNMQMSSAVLLPFWGETP